MTNFLSEFNSMDKSSGDVVQDLARMFEIRYRNKSKIRPPKILILGPVGSGRST